MIPQYPLPEAEPAEDTLVPLDLSGPTGMYAYVAIGAGACMSFCLFLEEWQTLSLIPAVMGLVGIAGRVRFMGPLMLATVLWMLGVQEVGGFTTWFLTLSLLVFLVAFNRFLALTIRIFPQARNRSVLWARLFLFLRSEETATKPQRRSPATYTADEVWNVLLWGMIYLVAAQIVLGVTSAEVRFLPGFWPNETRAMLLGWIGLAGVLGVISVIGLLRWKRLSPREAGIYLRSVVWRWNGKEMERVERFSARRERRRGGKAP